MDMRASQISLVCLTLIWVLCSASMGFHSACKESERDALLKFKLSFSYDPSNRLRSWKGKDCCNWEGVGCDNVTGNVINLDLGGNGEDSSTILFAGEVNPALLELKFLTYLNLSGNSFNGSKIPEFFGMMKKLRYLDLYDAYFVGKVPMVLGNLTELVVLNLGFCWNCEIERNSLEWVSKLANLEYLDLSEVNLTQAIGSLNTLVNLPSLLLLNLSDCGLRDSYQPIIRNSTISYIPLQHIDLSGNHFSRTLPQFIQNLSSLIYLDLSFNPLNSALPLWLGSNIGLRYLDLRFNNFSGSFPPFIQRFSFLTHLDLSYNQFTSSIPSWLTNNTHLEYLDLSYNDFIRVDGGIMSIIGRLCRVKYLDFSYNQLHEEVSELNLNVSRCLIHELEELHMENNSISGYLPIIDSLSSLQTLYLSNNYIEAFPSSWNGLSSLDTLDLSHNKLTNNVPSIIGNWSSLHVLDLSYNDLEGLSPEIEKLSTLYHLDLSHNNLSFLSLPSLANLSKLTYLNIGSNYLVLDFSSSWKPSFQLQTLSLQHCTLNSPFPKWLLSQHKLSSLYLSNTGIFGPLPHNIGNAMPSLFDLRLDSNYINDTIPRSLCALANLTILDLHNNSLSGMIPDCWEHSQVADVLISSNRLSGHIPISLTEIGNLQWLSLSNNSLEGELPPFNLSSVLIILDVGGNNLNGRIPEALPSSLEILILRENKFNGTIPLQLCSFYSLHIIDFAGNNFIGTIPGCLGSFSGMNDPSYKVYFFAKTLSSDEWSAVEVLKGEEREYTITLYLLMNMDLSCNNFVGVIPPEFSELSRLVGLNLSHNHLNGSIPMGIGYMKYLESLDLSFNNLSGEIPDSIGALDSLSAMNLSFNHLHGPIPTSPHLQTLTDPSIYEGNPGLCGDPLPNNCSEVSTTHSPTSTVLEDDNRENKHEKLWLYLIVMSGFATGFYGVIGVLVVSKKWRYAYFRIAEELADWIYVKVAVRITRAQRGW